MLFEGNFEDASFNPLMQEAQRLVDDLKFIHQAPFTITLRPLQKQIRSDLEINLVNGTHALGVYSNHSQVVRFFTATYLVQYTTFHSPSNT